MEEEKEREGFYCPKMYMWCDKVSDLSYQKGYNGVLYTHIDCNLVKTECKMIKRQQMFAKLEKCAN